jgi:putative ABC transport system substrate-binding protein
LGAGGLVISNEGLFIGRSEQLAALTVRHAVPAIYVVSEFTAAGGLMSYGGSTTESSRLVGAYTGRILKGEKPADLPVPRHPRRFRDRWGLPRSAPNCLGARLQLCHP